MSTPNLGETTCPICSRTFLVTPRDDCMMPACGCYGPTCSAMDREKKDRLCEACGVAHAMKCPKPKEKLHVPLVVRDHMPSADCWCEPEIVHHGAADGEGDVYLHREVH